MKAGNAGQNYDNFNYKRNVAALSMAEIIQFKDLRMFDLFL